MTDATAAADAADIRGRPGAGALLVEQLGDSVRFYKVGMELFMAGGYFELIDWLGDKGKKVFVDLKFFDVPETVRSAIRALAKRNVAFATIHGNQAIMEAAKETDSPVIVQASRTPGAIRVTAESDGLAAAETTLVSAPIN